MNGLTVAGVKVVAEVRPLDSDSDSWMQGDIDVLRNTIEAALMQALPDGDLVVTVKVSRLVA